MLASLVQTLPEVSQTLKIEVPAPRPETFTAPSLAVVPSDAPLRYTTTDAPANPLQLRLAVHLPLLPLKDPVTDNVGSVGGGGGGGLLPKPAGGL